MIHKTGNKYKTKDGLIGLLSTFTKDKECYCLLISIGSLEEPDYKGFNGNRYCDPIKVNNPYNISTEEMALITNRQPYELYTQPVTI